MTSNFLERSFDDGDVIDVNSVIAELHDDAQGYIHQDLQATKLSEVFDGCLKAANDSPTNMKVYLRVRAVQNLSASSTIVVDSQTTIVTTAPESSKRAQYTKTEERHYAFTRVFGPSSPQSEIYDVVGRPLLDRFLRGESCVLFAYGMTNAGKTYTIQGFQNNTGMLPRLVEAVISNISSDHGCELRLSMLEIYQEKVFDLMVKRKDKLTIRDGNGRVEVSKLSSSIVASPTEAVKLLDIAASNRSKAPTLLNTGSSRSHAVFTLTLFRDGKDTGAVFHVVDLAGAERGNRTKATWMQQKEANNINVSLMQLWRCLQGMKKKGSDGGNGLDLIPYRESKLTHLLMPELGRAGLSGVAMITCVNPQMDDYDETISILGNASIACKITEIVEVGRPAAASQPAMEKNKRKIEKISDSSSNRESVVRVSSIPTASKLSASNTETNDDNEAMIKRLQLEIARLEEENRVLVNQQLARETEIREEISEEMSKRSTKLLLQIQQLQHELNQRHDSLGSDHEAYILRSCKKAKKKHIEQINFETVQDFQAAEEEFELIKANYEQEVAKLREEKFSMEVEMNEWKERAQSALTDLNKLQTVVARDLSPPGQDDDGAKKKKTSLRTRLASTNVSTSAAEKPVTNKRSPLAAVNGKSSPVIFVDNKPGASSRPNSPARSISPSLKRSVSPNLQNRAPFIVRKVDDKVIASNNNENILSPHSKSVDAPSADANDIFKRLRSHFAMKM